MMKTVAAANRRPPSPAILDRTFSLPGFWGGAAFVRDQLAAGLLAGAALAILDQWSRT